MTDPSCIHASCEDYRASATIDLDHDRASQAAGDKIACPLLAIWGEHGMINRAYDAAALWQSRAALPIASAVLPMGHFIADQNPTLLLETLAPFLAPMARR